jgi:hypothetical protein
MTANEMMPAVGATVLIYCDGLQVTCEVVDVKTSWGAAVPRNAKDQGKVCKYLPLRRRGQARRRSAVLSLGEKG